MRHQHGMLRLLDQRLLDAREPLGELLVKSERLVLGDQRPHLAMGLLVIDVQPSRRQEHERPTFAFELSLPSLPEWTLCPG